MVKYKIFYPCDAVKYKFRNTGLVYKRVTIKLYMYLVTNDNNCIINEWWWSNNKI